MSSYFGFPAQNAQFASYMAAAAAATQTAAQAQQTAPPQAYQVAYPPPNQYNPQYTAMYSAAPIKTVTVVTSTSAVKPVQRAQGLYSNFVQAGQQPSSSNNGYDTAVLSAASAYSNTSGGANNESNPYPNYRYGASTAHSGGGSRGRRQSFWGKRNAGSNNSSQRAAVYYCDCCKISCAGPQTWQEHIAGSKHKKKDAALQAGKTAATPSVRAGASVLKCAVCDITVTGSDAFVAHVNGAKHQKTLKVYQQMGKPVPSSEPLVVTTGNQTSGGGGKKGKKIGTIHQGGGAVLGTAKVQFVGGTMLNTMSTNNNETAEIQSTSANAAETTATTTTSTSSTTVSVSTAQPRAASSGAGVLYLPNEREVAPVGAEYVEDLYGDNGKHISYKCKLCDCSFNDVFAKDMHLKGRRHRLSYKQKVDPSLNVEMKGSSYKKGGGRQSGGGRYFNSGGFSKGQQMAAAKQNAHDPYFAAPPPPPVGRIRPLFSTNSGFAGSKRNQQSFGTTEQDDRYVTTKHSSVYASQMELQAIQKLVLVCEGALKMTSDQLLDEEVVKTRKKHESAEKEKAEAVKKAEGGKTEAEMNTQKSEDTESKAKTESKLSLSSQQIMQLRQLRGVQRCGPLAKGLLIRGDNSVDLVVMCLEKPNVALLNNVASKLPANLKTRNESTSSEEAAYLPDLEISDFQVSAIPEESCIQASTLARPVADRVKSENEPGSPSISQRRFECRVLFTSQAFSDNAPSDAASDPSDMLPRSRCLEALAELRHAKWFQAKIAPNNEAMMALRILRDLSRRVPTWNPFPHWALELLLEKCAASATIPSNIPGVPPMVAGLTAAQLLRRVFECLAAGILLPGGPGICDPCEREPCDAAMSLNEQQREDITASAQHALRLVAFGLIWKVLGIDRIPNAVPAQKTPMKRKATDDPSPIGAKIPTVSNVAQEVVMGE